MATARGHRVALGTAADIADALEEWYRGGAADGFNIMPQVLPAGLNEFAELVIPELQRRGLFRTDYEGRTLRENVGLPRPDNRFVASDPSRRSEQFAAMVRDAVLRTAATRRCPKSRCAAWFASQFRAGGLRRVPE